MEQHAKFRIIEASGVSDEISKTDLFRKSPGMQKWQHQKLGLGGNDKSSPIPV